MNPEVLSGVDFSSSEEPDPGAPPREFLEGWLQYQRHEFIRKRISTLTDSRRSRCLPLSCRCWDSFDNDADGACLAGGQRNVGEGRSSSMLAEPESGTMGGFNCSLQHFVMKEVCDGCWKAPAGDSCDAWSVVVAWSAVWSAA